MASSETLRSVIDAGRTSKRLDELSTARVIGKIAEQLHAAQHKAGAGKAIGPITPAGISIDASGAAKLGLAEPAAVTYSSPEQITDDVGDRRSDVFSLGVVMWEALTHEPLFADALEVKTKPIAPPSEFNANIPAELGAICMKALARTSTDRYQSAKIMAAEIEAVLEEAGYADNDERIAEYMAELGKPASLPKVTLITPPHGVAPAPAPAPSDAPRPITTTKPPKLNDTLPSLGAPLPPILPAKRSPTEPPPIVDTKTDAPIDSLVAKPIEPKPAVLPSVLDNAKTVPFERAELPKAQSSSTVLGFAPLAHAEPPEPIEPAILVTPSAAQSDPILLATPKQHVDPEPLRPKPSASPSPPTGDDPHRVTQIAAPAPRKDLTPPPANNTAKATAVVALPKGRDSVEVLGGWGWGTDSHEAIAEPEYEDAPVPSSRKTLLYVIGGGVGLAAIVTVIAVGFGGGSSTKKPATQPTAAVQEGSAVGSDNIATGSDIVVVATGTPTAEAAGSAGSGVIAAAVIPDAAVAEVVAVDAAVAVAPPPAPDAAVVAVAPPPPPPPPPVVKHDEPKPKEHRAEPPRVAHVDPKPQDPYKAQAKPRGDAQTTYKQGLQAYLRGDTSTALTQLKASVDTDPNYAPTWRGLGLVYEKLNDKDKARAAYHRYLQLAPNAGDADNIRNRLERLF
ncbi:MAG TPA: tetratricopeptide repeat protein [Kofleriaceae bacterium]|nr:tetratricopeptide repeat protein [Kofleriaceae bacterium]